MDTAILKEKNNTNNKILSLIYLFFDKRYHLKIK